MKVTKRTRTGAKFETTMAESRLLVGLLEDIRESDRLTPQIKRRANLLDQCVLYAIDEHEWKEAKRCRSRR